ncbi:MAG TPA: FtsX-like permease family protein [Gemmatimonadales bacterium]|nr:FtsX-like permease family protein [Gemmatimonadales bacterium]
MNGARFVVRMAWRELRAEPRRLLLLAASVTAGVAALVAVNSFTQNLRVSVDRQARALLGADLAVTGRQPFSPKVEGWLDSLAARRTGCRTAAPCGELARLTNFSGMAYVPRTTGARLVQVSAVEGRYPFYGEIRTEPAGAWRALQAGHNVVVDPALLTALGARLGDTLALGEARFAITGSVTNLAGDAGVRAAFGPRVFIPARYLDETGLLGFGAQAERQAFVKLAPGLAPQAVAARWRPELRPERVRLRTVEDDRRGLNDTLARLARFLGLVALIALLLGGVGVASAVVVFVRRKLDTVAVLRCLGATARQVFAVYLAQAAALGLAGSAAGALIGLAVQQALPGIVRGLLPLDVRAELAPRALLLGVATGVWTALAFALLPLLAIRRVAPLAALRRPYEQVRQPGDWWRWPAAAALGASVVALAALEIGSWRTGAIFAAAIGAALGLLWLAAWLLVRAVRRWFPERWPYVWRQGLANLQRPGNQTAAVVLALGFGAFLLGTLVLVRHNLLRGLARTGGPARPNLVLFDIQPDQLPDIERRLRAHGLGFAPPVPIVPMRILSVKGRPARAVLADTGAVPGGERSNAWAFRREYRSTYRDSLVASETLVAGRWWPAGTRASSGSPAPISVETDVARELGVRVGDEIVWDVQGVPVPSRVASLREVEWARFEPNFFVVFAPGALEGAPRTYVTLTRLTDAGARGRLQRELAERFANVTTIDLSLVQQTIERLVDRVALAIRFMAAFSIATGVLVLIGATATSRLQRVREAVLLRTLGATRTQVLRIALAEHLALGLLAAVAAVVLAAGAGWGLARWFFDGRFWLPAPALAGIVVGVVALTVVVGLWSSREALSRTPLEALRGET